MLALLGGRIPEVHLASTCIIELQKGVQICLAGSHCRTILIGLCMDAGLHKASPL